MHVLFRKLDSLTHLHYTPKQKSAELKIVRNIPTINMEEVAPVAASNATLLGGFWILAFESLILLFFLQLLLRWLTSRRES